ncbi:hypothetical protein K493DRAFT_215045 [Basidiobolus meristosporus CBS 931.73]|uniref:RING-type domain-containing protein n=1 Tax=Basidiobolus meristosporus CBS 931.73 TaxID=1314790 RepID=A0A1Y1XWW3_9FUNG|nr:hypothetical protein K493DRAFT_231916 [Basidiobolus meristosporus CBS 931.73]ORX97993.1 hypothetical protein K493DRAFT_215045 [Basidiobolus meristosporus CBS 931.73]|eukprot:ORX89966.1 hypothetical protein K493DRAFT_231916 [Basidiobolus meristosporus CBS 931.73]
MDVDLHCNNVRCRRGVYSVGRACVTSCSHLFCVECANEAFSVASTCPTCRTDLVQKNDIALIDLHPSEGYKSSILSGLRPEVVIEICSRALAFWTYQTTQEVYFQEAISKSFERQNILLENKLQAVAYDANLEISSRRVVVFSTMTLY